MLILIKQPRIFCPVSKDRPIKWVIGTNDHIQQQGIPAYFAVTFEGFGAPNGETVDVNGVIFTTDDSTPYTDTTWDTGASSQEGAQNFADMLRSNYAFQGFQFWLSSSGGTNWTVNALAFEAETIQPWSFYWLGLSIPVTFTDNGNGQQAILRDYRVWYRLHEEDTPVGAERYGELNYDPDGFPAYGTIDVDVTSLARGLVRSTVPRYSWNGPQIDNAYWIRLHLRFGSIEGQTDCADPIRGKVYQTSEITVTNSVFQLHEHVEFLKHCPGGANPVRFLTDRPEKRTLCRSVHEWAHIWIENNKWFVGGFRVRYTWFAGDDDVNDYLGVHEIPLNTDYGAMIVDLGPGNNAVWNNAPGGTVRYRIQIMAQVIDEFDELDWVVYSNTLERRITNCSCKAAEVYFLEDRGSWDTIVFEYLDERQITQEAIEYEQRLDFDQQIGQFDHLYIEGARYSEAAIADQTFALISERVYESRRKQYEQLLRSPETYIKTINENGQERIRRVIFDREARTIIKRGEGVRIPLTFRFSTSLRTHT